MIILKILSSKNMTGLDYFTNEFFQTFNQDRPFLCIYFRNKRKKSPVHYVETELP